MRHNRDKKETISKLLLYMTYLRDFLIYLWKYDKKDLSLAISSFFKHTHVRHRWTTQMTNFSLDNCWFNQPNPAFRDFKVLKFNDNVIFGKGIHSTVLAYTFAKTKIYFLGFSCTTTCTRTMKKRIPVNSYIYILKDWILLPSIKKFFKRIVLFYVSCMLDTVSINDRNVSHGNVWREI